MVANCLLNINMHTHRLVLLSTLVEKLLLLWTMIDAETPSWPTSIGQVALSAQPQIGHLCHLLQGGRKVSGERVGEMDDLEGGGCEMSLHSELQQELLKVSPSTWHQDWAGSDPTGR